MKDNSFLFNSSLIYKFLTFIWDLIKSNAISVNEFIEKYLKNNN